VSRVFKNRIGSAESAFIPESVCVERETYCPGCQLIPASLRYPPRSGRMIADDDRSH
jgi:hypothetical protein